MKQKAANTNMKAAKRQALGAAVCCVLFALCLAGLLLTGGTKAWFTVTQAAGFQPATIEVVQQSEAAPSASSADTQGSEDVTGETTPAEEGDQGKTPAAADESDSGDTGNQSGSDAGEQGGNQEPSETENSGSDQAESAE
jgi:hypothetical protein